MQQPKREKLGEVTAPSGKLLLLDVGQLAFAAEIQPAGIEIASLPRRQPLFVLGERAGPSGGWRHVDLEVQPGMDVHRTVDLDDLVVDAMAQVMLVDEQALPKWVHDQPLDGNADLVFWGEGAKALAAKLDAVPVPDEGDDAFGWRDLPIQRVTELADEVQLASALVDLDVRPHSHHFQVLEQMRRSPTTSATIALGESKLCVFHTLCGEGLFPVEWQLDDAGQLIRVRIRMEDPPGE